MTKKTTLTKLTNLYQGLSQAIGSFKSAVGYDERVRELDWVCRANRALLDGLSHGIRRSARSADMVNRAMYLSSEADGMHVDAEEEAKRMARRIERAATCSEDEFFAAVRSDLPRVFGANDNT